MDSASVETKNSFFEANDRASDKWSGFEKRVDKNDAHFGAGSSTFKKRPTNLKNLLDEENLRQDTTEANFSSGDISESEEIWVFDVPKTINPKNFKGQTIKLGKKNDFQIGNDIYETSSITGNDKQHLSFVFNTGSRKRPYKMVNVKPAGSVRVRQKLARVLDASLAASEKVGVPFPKNLKIRHPLFGRNYNEKFIGLNK